MLTVIQDNHVHCHGKKAKLNVGQKGLADCHVHCHAKKVNLNVTQNGQADCHTKRSS